MEAAGIRDAARLARDCVVMTQAVALGRWISTAGPRPVTPRRVLRKPDLPAAATVIGVPMPARLRTAADVPAIHRPWCLAECAEDARFEHAWNWLDAQPGPVGAARRLLVAGASMEPRLRWIATCAVELLGEDALPVWRDMVQVPGIGPHARFALYEMEAGPEPSDAQWLWLAVESAARALAESGPDEAITVLWDCLPAQQLAADDLDHRVPWPAQAIIRRRDRSRRR